MKIVIAYTPTMLRPEVKQLGESVGAIFADVSHSDMAYGELVRRLWAKGETFFLLEHDVLPTVECLTEMAGCDREWCAAWAPRYSGAVLPDEDRPKHPIREKEFGLFLNKFSASLIARTPHVIGAFRGLRWTQIDLRLLPMLQGSGAMPCQHGPVMHLRQEHPAWAMTDTEWADA